VRGAWRLLEPEHGLHRPLHLPLAGGAVTGHRALDLGGRQREHAHVVLARGEIDDPARVTHQNRSAGEPVLSIEILDHEQAGAQGLDEAVHCPVQGVEAGLERLVGAGADHARIADDHAAGTSLQHAEPGGDQPRVHAHDAERARPR
jgi:hypothetical protein